MTKDIQIKYINDQKIEDISTNLKEFDIPVSNVEPVDDSKFWFEII